MATQQDEGGVPFAIAHEMQHFRLFELPQELVELIEAPDPPLLSIKSHAPSTASGAPNPKPAYAVLCTPNKSFQVRQVQTSNSLFVTQPALENHGNDIPIPVTRAIASCTATLELLASEDYAAALLRESLPVYDIVDGEVHAEGNGITKASTIEDLPLSDGQCQAGWDELIAFEHEGSSFQPSAAALMLVWNSINAVALAEGVKLDSQFLTHDITTAITEEGHPPNLVHAILTNLSTADQDVHGPWSCLDRKATVAFTGKALLRAKQNSDYPVTDFIDSWEDVLPAAWRKDAQLSAIDQCYELPTETTIRSKDSNTTTAQQNSTSSSAKPSARKWHEKFGRTRKT